MDMIPNVDEKNVLLTIQNNRKPSEMIYLMWDKPHDSFETQGLKELFGVKEICIKSSDLLQSLEKYANLLSFLLETMSTAKELNLPYAFQNEFEFGNEKYTIYEEGDYRVLKPA